ncbi:tyrosine-type recombinase/integrase [Pseudomonas sp. Pse1]|uniref:tyrosine-type recombinase/integrase n=1 Tax=Pseudomonas sp. Pse1 TaxID=2926020 RepID=UPI0021196E58|nr:tyrosine-type recombinase/integrase [Pseudomonas sp. Pse1]
MGDTVYTRLSETMIGRLRRDEAASYLRDEHYPRLRFRYRKTRTRGTWDAYLGGRWRKVGNYPEWDCKTMLERLPHVLEQLNRGAQPVVSVGMLVTMRQLLAWFLNRQLRTRTLSNARKSNCRSMINIWLLPRLDDVLIGDLNKELLDRLLVHPMQMELTPAYIRKVYGVLVAAIRCAVDVGALGSNPLLGVTFSDFRLAKIKPRTARLRPEQVDSLVSILGERFEEYPRICMIALLMLCFGLRLGETRKLRWAYFHMDQRLLIIPAADTKTGVELELPLTDAVWALLEHYRARCGDRGSEYLFPGAGGLALSEASVLAMFRELSDGQWTSHDLRKLARACWARMGVDYLVGELLLNHAMPGLTAVYIQTQLPGLKRAALERWHGEGSKYFSGLKLEKRFGLA